MKKVLTIVLVFAVILAVLLGADALWKRFAPEPEPVEETEREMVVTNTMDPENATVIRLADGATTTLGVGAVVQADGASVTIVYPGTYRVEGTLTDGQIVVDLGDFNGTVYLILNGASVTSASGPALYVAESGLTVLYLVDDTDNFLQDGQDYLVQEQQEKKTGAGIYSADDLVIAGGGALTVYGRSSDGIRTKDAMAVMGGALTVYSQDDGLQASDYLKISGGDITVGAYGDGVSTTDGFVEISDGSLNITSGGDGIDAVTDVRIGGGTVRITAFGGPVNYAEAATREQSAKGVKAENIEISGGRIELSTADDGIHAARDVSITDGVLVIATGDDGIHAASRLDIRGAAIDVTESYEGLEGETVAMSETICRATASNNAVDAGEGGFTGYSSKLFLRAPRAVSSDAEFNMMACDLLLDADGTDSLFSFTSADIVGGTVICCAATGRSDVLLAKGRLPGSLFIGFDEPLASGTPVAVADASGALALRYVTHTDTGAILIASGAMLEGQPYILTAGGNTVAADYTADGCFVSEPEIVVPQSSGRGGFPGMPPFGRP